MDRALDLQTSRQPGSRLGIEVLSTVRTTPSPDCCMTSGEFLVNVLEGHGTVLLAPIPYWQVLLLRQVAASAARTSS